jgi:hypothetical protein
MPPCARRAGCFKARRELQIVGEAANGLEAIAQARAPCPMSS